jgi:heavy metal sensor kinase
VFLNSIRWRLQLWYGLILIVVLSGFGFTAYEMDRNRRIRSLDEELQRRVGVMSGVLGQGMGPRPGAPLRRGRDPALFPPDGEPIDQPDGPDFPPGPRRPGADRRLPGPPNGDVLPRAGDLRLGPRQAALFDETDTNGFYYVIWRRDGEILAKSTNAPTTLSKPPRTNEEHPAPVMEGTRREVYHFTPPGEVIAVGHTMIRELRQLRATALTLTAVGGGVLLLGLAGGWWLATRAIRPINQISATAARISAGDLSQRIDASDAESELGQLASILNSTFARLEAAFAQQKQFASDAAHELRTPVSVLLTQTQSVLNRERPVEEYRQALEACQRAAQRMRRLIESLLVLARFDAGQEKMQRVSFNISELLEHCITELQPLADQRRIKFISDLPNLICVGDPDRLAQVFTNLLTNAINYNRDDGEIRVAASSQNGIVTVAVTDSGVGILPEELPNLFKRFYRADKSRVDGRSGLGLAISKAIIEAHGGTITVLSKPAQGTRFEVNLPNALR